MSSSNTSSTTAAINYAKQSNILSMKIWLSSLLILGVIGHTMNIYVFTRSKFRHNPCTRYFLAATISGYIVVLFTIPVRFLQLGSTTDIFASSLGLCQFLSYFLACIRVLPSWFIGLASVDRFLCSSSSTTVRGWSNIRVASYVIFITCLFMGVAYIHIPFNYIILLPQRTCTFVSSTYQTFLTLWNLLMWSWIPTACMLVFGLLILRNIRKGRIRVAPSNQSQRNQKKTDRQLIRMLLIQCFVLSTTTMSQTIGNLYISITSMLRVKNDLDKAMDNLLYNNVGCVALSGPCLSFYVFTLSSQLFRNELANLFCCLSPVRTENSTNTGIKQTTKD